jgi:hypothetical protein
MALDASFLQVRETIRTGSTCADVDITISRLPDGTLDYNFEDGNGRAILTR